MSAWTKGPWDYSVEGGRPYIRGGRVIIAKTYRSSIGEEIPGVANARLISKAPEMAELLQNYLNEWRGMSNEELRQQAVAGGLDQSLFDLIVGARALLAQLDGGVE